MAGKKTLLTLNSKMYAELESYAKANFMTMQEGPQKWMSHSYGIFQGKNRKV